MKTTYYPGCTLPQKARDFDLSARTSCELLGIELTDLEKWVCCGSAFKLDRENVMQHLAPFQNLVEAARLGDRLMTLCVFCYNALKRANHLLQNEPDKRDVITGYLEKEYDGTLEVAHLLELLRDDISFATIREKVSRPLAHVRAAPFYGCLLLRPQEEVGFDAAEDPSVFEDFLEALGAEVVRYPHRLECCGSYLSLKDPDHTAACVDRVLRAARAAGANAIVTSCPMCNFNFETYGAQSAGEDLHVLYFTELLAVALGAEPARCGLAQHTTDVAGFLGPALGPAQAAVETGSVA